MYLPTVKINWQIHMLIQIHIATVHIDVTGSIPEIRVASPRSIGIGIVQCIVATTYPGVYKYLLLSYLIQTISDCPIKMPGRASNYLRP